NLLCCLQVDHKLKLRGLLHRQVSRFGTFQDLVHVKSRPPIKVSGIRAIGHEAALIDKVLLWVNRGQPMFAGKLNDPFSFSEKEPTPAAPNPAPLLLLCRSKGPL